MFESLTVEETLYYAARLRLPKEMSRLVTMNLSSLNVARGYSSQSISSVLCTIEDTLLVNIADI